jgi:hypothetical protein
VQVHGGMGFIEETGAAQHYPRRPHRARSTRAPTGCRRWTWSAASWGWRAGSRERTGGRHAATAKRSDGTVDLLPLLRRRRAVERGAMAGGRRGTPTRWRRRAVLQLMGDVVGGWLLAKAASRPGAARRRLPAQQGLAGAVLRRPRAGRAAPRAVGGHRGARSSTPSRLTAGRGMTAPVPDVRRA